MVEYNQYMNRNTKGQFVKGHIPWSKGIMLKNKHPLWKGDKVGYEALHEWVERWKGAPRKCEKCGTTRAKRYHWSNKSGKYKRDLKDWQRLCASCHRRYDLKHLKGKGKKFFIKNHA